MKKTIIVFSMLMLVVSGTSWGSGLSIPEQGAAALGLSASMTARSEDLSALYYNPAGLENVQGFEIYAGITPIMPSHTYSPFREDDRTFEGQEAESNVFLPPQIYAAWRASENIVLGIGIYAPYGLGTEWDEEWTGRYSSTFADIQTVFINPTIQYTVSDKLSLGFGASYITATATIEKMVDTGSKLAEAGLPVAGKSTAMDSKFGIEGDGSAWGMNAGLLYHATEKVHFGASFRSSFDLEFDGDAKFTHKDALKAITLPVAMGGNAFNLVSASMPASQSGTATLNMPWMLNVGTLLNVSEDWDVSADVNWVGWSNYEELVLDFDDDLPMDKQVQDKDWENTFTLRGGASYDMNEKTILRFGLMYDKNPVPDETIDPQLPDSDRFGVSIGCGYKLGKVRIDAGYVILSFNRREKDNAAGFDRDKTGDGFINRFDTQAAGNYPVANGMYDSVAHLLSISASIPF